MHAAAGSPPQKRSWPARAHEWLVTPSGRFIRYVIVLAILVVAIVGFFNKWFDLCEVVTSEAEGVTRTCAGPDLTSASVLAAVLLIFLLLWLDLSEFSAFGVTVKRLVEKVDQTVTETERKVGRIEVQTAGIDRTTLSTSDAARDLRDDLREIRGTLQSLADQRGATPDTRDARGPESGWSGRDEEEFRRLCLDILGPDELEHAVAELRERAYAGGTAELLRDPDDGLLAALFGTLWVLSRRAASPYGGRGSADEWRSGERDPLLELLLRQIDRLLRAYLDGHYVDPETLLVAAATLLRIDQRRW